MTPTIYQFREIEVDAQASSPGTIVDIWTDVSSASPLVGQMALRDSVTLGESGRRSWKKRLLGTVRAHRYKVIVSSPGTLKLFRIRLYVHRLGGNYPWQWITVPVPESGASFQRIPIPIPRTSTQFVRIPIGRQAPDQPNWITLDTGEERDDQQ